MKISIRITYFWAIIACILANMRVPYLPLIETGLFICLLVVFNKQPIKIINTTIIIFCSNHYVVMDYVYRLNSYNFPSIYTQNIIGGVKYLDLIVVTLFLYSLLTINNINSLFRRVSRVHLPFVSLVLSIIGFLITDYSHIAINQLLFVFRSIMLIIALTVICSNFSFSSFYDIATLAIFTWISNMIFSIVFPPAHSYVREIFGIKGLTFFAGDEYLTIIHYSAILLLLFRHEELLNDSRQVNIKGLLREVIFAYFLGLVSLRKGAFLSLVLTLLLILIYLNDGGKLWNQLYNFLLIIIDWIIPVFLIITYSHLPSSLQLAFYDYNGVTSSALQSLYIIFQESPLKFFFGIGPFGKYKIAGLTARFDYDTSFGQEVGQEYRYMIWEMPGGRLILNNGFIGLVYFYIYQVLQALKNESALFFLLFELGGIFYFKSISPVFALAYGISFAFLIRYYESVGDYQ